MTFLQLFPLNNARPILIGIAAAFCSQIATATPIAPQPHFDPRSYGAKADGCAFDTEALQKAIDACAGTGGSVILAGGTFLTKPLELRGNILPAIKHV